MKILKLTSLSILSIALLAGCGASKSATAPIAAIENLPLKNAEIKEGDLKRWSHLDIFADTIPGMSVDKAYKELIKNKKGKKIIVGVVDSGVDIEHPDLQGVIWTNAKEIAGNGIDDDKNGFIDDMHGWNFLGNIEGENLEMTRIVKKGDDGSETYKKAKAEFDKETQEAMAAKQQYDFIFNADKAIRAELKKENYTVEDLKKLTSTNPLVNQVKPRFIQILNTIPKAEFDEQILEAKEHFDNQVEFNLNLDFNARKLLGDNPDDINDTKYGNNNVIGPKKEGATHGTHVAGIISQVRNNGIGGDGIANNVEVLVVRAVPDGDEYDKDIALGIRYAVDNGARVINGSFGKSYSPHKEWVYDALKYAAEKDVLVVLAAGNEGTDLDADDRYPNDRVGSQEISNNVIKVGAVGPKYGSELVADFSNYGTKDVDVFAPGVQIYATIPEGKYKFLQGTSMASPNVAGVAALIRSYYPELTAPQVKQILMDSGVATSIDVVLAGEKGNKRSFSKVSKTGRMVNAYNALIMAGKMAKK
ncbi:MAG TPA: S8 family peptidase [Flavobacterium sp.]|nr:S8 family peptidase [Flavobacterium sp.]